MEQAACMKSQISMCAERGGMGGAGGGAPNGRLSDTSALCSGVRGGGVTRLLPMGKGGILLAIQ